VTLTRYVAGANSFIWIEFGLNGFHFAGVPGTTVRKNGEKLEHARVGVTVALPFNRLISLKPYGSIGAFTKAGTVSIMLGMIWQLRWGGRLKLS